MLLLDARGIRGGGLGGVLMISRAVVTDCGPQLRYNDGRTERYVGYSPTQAAAFPEGR